MSRYQKQMIQLMLVIIGFLPKYSFSQSNVSKANERTSVGKFSLGYLSNDVYYGRQDSLTTPYATPMIGYFDKSGFYITGSVSYLLAKKTGRIDLTSIDMGYEHNFTEDLSGEIHANKSWYNQSSSNIKNDIKGGLGGSIGYDLHVLQLNGGAELTFANKTDMGLNVGVSHLFVVGSEDHQFSIEPSLSANWSTLHSYEGYVNKKIGRKQSVGLPANTTITALTTVENNRMTLLDYEFTMPISFEAKNIGFVFTPTFSMPRNPIYTTTTVITKLNGNIQNSQTFNSTPNSEKTLANTFFGELTLYFKF